MRLVIIGAGYVGLSTGLIFAYLGNEVTFIDKNKEKVDKLNRGVLPIFEPGMEELFMLVRENITFTNINYEAIQDAEIIFITVGTPPLSDGSPNMNYFKETARMIGENIIDGKSIIINKSTVPIGCGDWTETLISDNYEVKNGRKLKQKLSVVSNPEFFREGASLYDSFYPNRIVIGYSDPKIVPILKCLYEPIIKQNFIPPLFLPRPEGFREVPFIETDLASAELIKYSANSFLATKISFINEIACLAEKVGADIMSVAKGIGFDNRIGKEFLKAGIGWGGSCFGKDTAALIATAKDYGLDMPIIEAAREINYLMRDKVIEITLEKFKILKGKVIGIMGLSFKPFTDDLRDSPALNILKELISKGSKVKVHDPVINEDSVKKEVDDAAFIYTKTIEELFIDTDCVILVTEWPQYSELCWEELTETMKTKFVIDGRNFLDKNRLENMGIIYRGIGI